MMELLILALVRFDEAEVLFSMIELFRMLAAMVEFIVEEFSRVLLEAVEVTSVVLMTVEVDAALAFAKTRRIELLKMVLLSMVLLIAPLPCVMELL